VKTVILHIQRRLIPCMVLLLICFASNAQPLKKFSSHSYTVNEGLLSNQVEDMVEDENGFLWISTGIGLQHFDGNTFETIQLIRACPKPTIFIFFSNGKGTEITFKKNKSFT